MKTYFETELGKLYCGSTLAVLKQLPEESVNCCVTSPPYWGLRDYGVKGQLGLEKTFQEYITKLCDIFDEVKRVLRKDGTCWVNLGDSYSNSGKGGDSERAYSKRHTEFGKISDVRRHGKPTRVKDLPPKSLCNIPARFSIEMQNRKWTLRNEIIWHKPNCMPSSAKDRFTADFEKIFFFVKNKKYWFETQREPHSQVSLNRIKKPWKGKLCKGHSLGGLKDGDMSKMCHPEGRNKRTVWQINTKSFKDAHFAVFPEELIETPIKAGCPKNGVVIDIFSGSGTVPVFCEKHGYKWLAIDLSGEYCDMAAKRIKAEADQIKMEFC